MDRRGQFKTDEQTNEQLDKDTGKKSYTNRQTVWMDRKIKSWTTTNSLTGN